MTIQEKILFTCNECGETKPSSEFYKSKMNRSGYRWQCKQCLAKTDRRKYAKDDVMRGARFKYGKTDMARYTRLKSNAKRRGTEFLLDKLEFLIWFGEQEKLCYYCGISLTTDGNRAEQLSVDRKDNLIGYTLENIALCCQRCNTIKGDIFTEQEMVEIAERYLKPKMEVLYGQER